MTRCQVPIRRINGGWEQLRVPDARAYGIKTTGPNRGQWHSALSYEYKSPSDFEILPICDGTAFCDFRPGRAHLDMANSDLIFHRQWLGGQFVRPVVQGDYDSLPLLPFPEDDAARNQLFHSIENLEGSIKLVLKLDDPIRLKGGLGAIKYFLYDSIDIHYLHDGLGIRSLPGNPAQDQLTGLFREARLIESSLRKAPGVTWDHVFKLFLLGLLKANISIGSGISFGQPRLSQGSRSIDLYAFTQHGPVDPLLALQKLRQDGKLDDQGFLAAPSDGGAVAPTFQWTDQPASTQDRLKIRAGVAPDELNVRADEFKDTTSKLFLYPFPLLRFLKKSFGWNKVEWREVGDGQKGQHLEKLMRSAGSPGIARTFDWNDRFNVFQLEAAVEHFCKGTQSEHGPGNTDGKAVDVDVTVNFLDKAPLGWVPSWDEGVLSRSGIYLVQIDRMADLGGPRTGLEIKTAERQEARAFDEYEGCMFLVSGGEIRKIVLGFTSFTSKRKGKDAAASSIEGNRRYLFWSRKSPRKVGHNYAFIISHDRRLSQTGDLPAWFYWASTATPLRELGEASPGKTAIVLHRGNSVVQWDPPTRQWDPTTLQWNGSHGCQVAPARLYYQLRTAICREWLKGEAPSEGDAWVSLVAGSTKQFSEMIFQNTNGHFDYEAFLTSLDTEMCGGPNLFEPPDLEAAREAYSAAKQSAEENQQIIPAEYWDRKIRGTYFLVRPFETTLPEAREKRLIQRPNGI